MGDVLYLILRRLRAPLITIIVVYAVSMIGLVAIPGVDAQGKPWQMGFFHAFYVMSYTATTIGFGEIPNAFTDAQRLWVTFAIFLSVIGWAYALGAVIALGQDRVFQLAVQRALFMRRVRRLREPFILICGYGQSGSALARALDAIGWRVVIVELDATRAAVIAIEDFLSPPLVLVGDARLPEVIEAAGVEKPECQGVLALTTQDETNQAVAIGARVANAQVEVIAKVTSDLARSNLEAIGGVRIIDPFHAFAENIRLDLASPEVLQVEEWLTGVPNAARPGTARLPKGHWVIGGYGRFGRAVAAALEQAGQSWSAFDPRFKDLRDSSRAAPGGTVITTIDTEDALAEAGIGRAVCLVACTDSDSTNLAMARQAHRLNPATAIVIRRNKFANRRLIEAASPQMLFAQSAVMTHECLQILTSPLLASFLAQLRQAGTPLAQTVCERLEACVGDRVPNVWSFSCDERLPGMRHALHSRTIGLRIDDLMRNPDDPSQRLALTPLYLRGGSGEHYLPPPGTELTSGDIVLFAGTADAQSRQRRFQLDPSPIDYLRSGREPARGWLFRRLGARATPPA